ncbi:MAG: GNAT family N-acetyltransferase, partial [Dinoroseobacter sp.]|nr:GNAT family N-acetyltransferase [Dinoroseobacter sp.]
ERLHAFIEGWGGYIPQIHGMSVALRARHEGQVIGFQWIAPADYLPAEAADISTFAKQGQTQRGIGTALFAATKGAAPKLGYTWINANIRADNSGGLRYYNSLGFTDYGRKTNVTLRNGLVVDKILKRFDL